jgi:hypothetical protein
MPLLADVPQQQAAVFCLLGDADGQRPAAAGIATAVIEDETVPAP